MFMLTLCSLLLHLLTPQFVLSMHNSANADRPWNYLEPEELENLIGQPVPDKTLNGAYAKENLEVGELVAITDPAKEAFIGMIPARYGIIQKKKKNSNYVVIIEKNPVTGTELTETITSSHLYAITKPKKGKL